MRWKVGVEGPPGIVHLLSIVISDHDIRLVAGRNVSVLHGSSLDSLDDACSVRCQAERIVTILSGSARILLGSTEPLQVMDVTDARADVSEDPGSHLPRDPGHLVGRGGRTASGKSGGLGTWSQSSLFKSLRQALSDPAMEKALRLRDAGSLGWPELVRVCEIFEQARGRRAFAGTSDVTRAAIRQLHRTATWVAAADARVQGGLENPQPPPGHLTLSEARCLVDHLLLAWLGCAARTAARRGARAQITQ
jgi:hypothetical protein